MAYIGQTLTEGTRRAQTYTATAGQTTFNAVYSIGNVDVYQASIRAPIYDTTQNTMKTALFQTNDQTMGTDTTIPSTHNASCNGPLTIASSITLTVNGNLTII